MRELSVHTLESHIYELFLQSCCHLGEDVLRRLRQCARMEESPIGQEILNLILENDRIADQQNMPICQDTGMATVFLKIGQDVHLTGGDLTTAVNRGIRRAYADGHFRASVLSPIDRKNTGDNTPGILHIDLVPGEQVEIRVLPKGFGSENMSRLWMLKPSDGIEGIRQAIVETVRLAGGSPCPPVIVGVGIGGTSEYALYLAKHALLRPCGEPSPDPVLAQLEARTLSDINRLGIGPQGLGGRITALAVHAEQYPTHIAGLPVGVSIQCHVARSRTRII